ncbi:MAG: TlpA disulfide reductase family protein [Proteobacteria bacterium]|nr:TlpA disulfide reductase family protein [Pseudomonadota bacterium]
MIRLPAMTLRVLLTAGWLASATALAASSDTAPALTLPARAPAASVSLETLRGRVVMVNFWASWCGPCREEFPLLDQMYKRYEGAGLTMLGINVEPEPSDAEDFLAKTPVSFPIAYDSNGLASRIFHVDSMPSTVLIDRHGVVRWSHRGYGAGDENQYLDQIRALLREK